jgi:protein-tyrosine phosphatase
MAHVLHVCTANQIRSAMAERMMREALRGRAGSLVIGSAGVQAHPGIRMFPEALDEMASRGIDASDFRSTVIDPDAVAGASLVLAATRWHQDMILAMVPSARAHTFTWRELAWLLQDVRPEDVPGDTLTERVAGLAALAHERREKHLAPPASFDVEDPVGGPRDGYRRAADEIDAALGTLLALL